MAQVTHRLGHAIAYVSSATLRQAMPTTSRVRASRATTVWWKGPSTAAALSERRLPFERERNGARHRGLPEQAAQLGVVGWTAEIEREARRTHATGYATTLSVGVTGTTSRLTPNLQQFAAPCIVAQREAVPLTESRGVVPR